MKRKRSFLLIPTIILAAMLSAPSIGAQPAVPVEPAQEADQAMAAVDRMADFLANAKGFSVTADTGFDAVQESGQKIEFGETRNITLERPDRLRVDTVKRGGGKSQFTFDGKELALYYEKANAYASEAKPGTVDEVVRYFIDDLDMRLPLGEMLSSRFKDVLKEKVRDAIYVEESFIGGVACDHVALRGDNADMQLWIAKGAQPLPQRAVITYKKFYGQPQFWAQFRNWDLAPKISNGLFTFIPPQGAKKIAFSPKQGMQPVKVDAGKDGKL